MVVILLPLYTFMYNSVCPTLDSLSLQINHVFKKISHVLDVTLICHSEDVTSPSSRRARL